MKLSQFNFDLPQDRIASEPTRWRDEARLMVLHKDTGEIEHRLFKDIIDYFGKGDIFVLNDTKVFPSRMYGKKEKTGADIMVLLLRELNREQRLWDVIVDPARKIRIGNKLYFGEDESLVAEVIDNTTSRGRTLRFLFDGTYEEFKETLFSLGEPYVPEWVKEKTTPEDIENYQTIFAKQEGAVSAPAAGLHFSRELFNRMILKDIEKTFITVHMGIGQFRTVDVEDLSKHRMDSERLIISEEASAAINKAKVAGLKTTVEYIGRNFTNDDLNKNGELFNTADKNLESGWEKVTLYTMSGKSIVALGLCHLLADVGKELLIGTSLAVEVGKCVKCLWNGLTCCGSHAVLNGFGTLAQVADNIFNTLDIGDCSTLAVIEYVAKSCQCLVIDIILAVIVILWSGLWLLLYLDGFINGFHICLVGDCLHIYH